LPCLFFAPQVFAKPSNTFGLSFIVFLVSNPAGIPAVTQVADNKMLAICAWKCTPSKNEAERPFSGVFVLG